MAAIKHHFPNMKSLCPISLEKRIFSNLYHRCLLRIWERNLSKSSSFQLYKLMQFMKIAIWWEQVGVLSTFYLVLYPIKISKQWLLQFLLQKFLCHSCCQALHCSSSSPDCSSWGCRICVPWCYRKGKIRIGNNMISSAILCW